MKLKFSYIAYTVIAIALVIGVSRAYALTGPRGSAPSQSEIFTPINNSSELQIKKGALTTTGAFGYVSPGGVVGFWPDWFPESSGNFNDIVIENGLSIIPRMTPGSIIIGPKGDGGLVLAPWLFTTKMITHNITVGGSGNQDEEIPEVGPLTSLPGTAFDDGFLKVDLSSRGTSNNSIEGTQAIRIYTNNTGGMCSSYTTIKVDAPMLELKTGNTNQSMADMIARQVRLTDNYPHRDSVLSYSPATYNEPLGGTIWATIQVVNGQLQLVPNTQ